MTQTQRWAVGLVLFAALFAAAVALVKSGTYGFSIFLLAPVLVGALAAWIIRPKSAKHAADVGFIATLLATGSMLVVGVEGFVCSIMALPLTLSLGMLGSCLTYAATATDSATSTAAILVLLVPASLTWDLRAIPPVFQVRSAIEIAASPQQVWKNVIAFPELPEPREWFFRTGLAYPQRARIIGTGVGAVRYCEFSTGPFVEPIKVWDEPRLLRFSVTENPAPMREWSPYGQILPKHLHGYMISKQGEFRLTPLPNGHTLLEGTTWYQHGLWPAQYWRWWSDAIIHRIHMRVLDHIRTLAENDQLATR